MPVLMAALPPQRFDRKFKDARNTGPAYEPAMTRTHMDRRDWAILLLLALIWGAAFFFIGIAVRHVAPFTYVWARLSIAALVLLLFVRWQGHRLALSRGDWAAMGVLALLNTSLPFVLFGWSQQHIASGVAAILNATTPIWGVLVAHFLTRDERMTPSRLAGVVLGFGGVTLMIGPAILVESGGKALPKIACIVAALSYAFAAVYAKRFRAKRVAPLTVATGQLVTGAVMMTPVALLVDRPWQAVVPPLSAIAAIVALAVVCSAFAYILYFKLIERAGATNALLVTLLVPPVAILLGAMFLGEHLHARDFAGLALIAAGLAAIDGRMLRLIWLRPRPAA